MIIDAHAHIGSTPYVTQTVEDLLRELDAAAVDRAVVCPMGAELAVRNRDGNDRMAAAMRAHPDRLTGFATVNPWWEAEALTELERAVTQLGLPGLKLHPVLQGFQIDDDLVLPVVERAIELGVVIYVHTGTPVLALPLQLLELASRYPEGKFIAGHMGGADFYVDVPLSFPRADNVWLETSLSPHAAYVEEALTTVGAERMLFGSDSPTSRIASELFKIGLLELAPEVEAQVLGGNAHALLESVGAWR
ncbi:MAG TPA: amidohydrolase family protein [Solirubrobacter sp.]|nr:amidohydrolase family protein [Solirubrobacter sp.]